MQFCLPSTVNENSENALTQKNKSYEFTLLNEEGPYFAPQIIFITELFSQRSNTERSIQQRHKKAKKRFHPAHDMRLCCKKLRVQLLWQNHIFELGLIRSLVVQPTWNYCAEDFIKAGSDIVSVHAEQSSTIHLHRVVNLVGIITPKAHQNFTSQNKNLYPAFKGDLVCWSAHTGMIFWQVNLVSVL